jgi:predicted transcriptional regulator
MSPLKQQAAKLMGISPRALSHYLAKYPLIEQTATTRSMFER